MPKLFEELEVLCNADKRKSTNELPFVSAHMLIKNNQRQTLRKLGVFLFTRK